MELAALPTTVVTGVLSAIDSSKVNLLKNNFESAYQIAANPRKKNPLCALIF
jgi:hypothetical protein